jgi:hypothetical protein
VHVAAMGGWHQEFLQTQSNVRQDPLQNLGVHRGFSGVSMTNFGMQGPSLYDGVSVGSEVIEAHVQHYAPQQEDDMYDDAAFEQAFEAAGSELAQQESLESGRNILGDESTDIVDKSVVDVETDAAQKQHDQIKDDPDELAQTAGRLLDSVKDNQSQKFQESTFLSLMRRIRDREVRVEGDKMVEVGNTPSTTTVDHL